MRNPALPRLAALLALSAALGLVSCAPPPRPGSSLAELASRYEAGRAARERLLRALSAEVVLRVDGRATGRLPALPATLRFASPDRARVQVDALLGVGLDVLVDADSLRAWAPGQRVAFAAPCESLGIADPVRLAGRALAAAWPVPPEAWRDASADSGGWRLSWRDGSDTLTMAVDRDARPVEVRVNRAGARVRVRYSDWTRVAGGTFPGRWELADDSGWARVQVRLDEATAGARPGDDWFQPRRYSTAPYGWTDLRSLLQRGELP